MTKATAIFAVLVLTTDVLAQYPLKYSFGVNNARRGYINVQPTNVFSSAKGFGFEPGANIHCLAVKGKIQGICSSDKPFYFSVVLPEGNFRVTVTLGGTEPTDETVKAELRRLMLQNLATKKGETITRSFLVNVRRPQISTGGEVKLKDRERTSEWWAWDEKLTLEFNGTNPMIHSIEIEPVKVPTIFLLGDSTVCDQPSEPYASWGQMLTGFFGSHVAIANHAESGESLRSSLGAKRLDKVLSVMKPGDYLLIQYGHNDEKEKGEGVGAFTTFKASLKYFVEEARKKGGNVILITPVQRRTFDASGKIANSHGDYPEAVRQAAKEENVAMIDLNAISKDLYESLGPERSGILFKEGDGTHHNNFGAYELAKCIVQSIRDQKLSIGKYLMKGLPTFDPKRPDPREAFAIPASPTLTTQKPLGN